jgi:hypothetical protein
MLYEMIPVTIDGEIQYFNFDTTENEYGQVCKIWSGGKTMQVDEDFTFIKGDMPADWILPAIDKLKQILGYEEV